MKKIVWEYTDRHNYSIDEEGFTDIRYVMMKYSLLLKEIAMCKFRSVYLLSISYKEKPYVFQPELVMIFETNKSVQYYGVYYRGYEAEDDNDQPIVCIRKGNWNYEMDKLSNFDDCISNDYSIEDQTLIIQNVFLNQESSKRIIVSVSEISNLLLSGIRFENKEDHLLDNSQVYLECWNEEIKYSVSFHPIQRTCIDLEEKISELIKTINHKVNGQNLLPDSDMRISFLPSIIDWTTEFENWKKLKKSNPIDSEDVQ